MNAPRNLASQRGFTLVELMVAIAIGLFLMVGLIGLLLSNVQTRSELDKSSQQIENGRYAIQLLTDEFDLAGFYGPVGSTTFNTVVPPAACPAAASDLGYTAVASPGTSSVPFPIYALSSVPSCISNVKADTAMVLVSRVSTSPTALASLAATETYLQNSSCTSDATPFTVAAGAASNFTLLQKDCLAAHPGELRKVVQRIYFVSTCNECGTDTNPTLKVAEYVNGAMAITPLVEGIENFQVDYGIDMDGNGSPDCYISNPDSPVAAQIDTAVCPQTAPAYDWTASATNWSNVVTVRIHVLARNLETSAGWSDTRTYDMGLGAGAVGPFNDATKRHVYSAVSRLINVSGQRE